MLSNKDFMMWVLKNEFADLAAGKDADFLFHSCNPPAVPYLGMYLTDLAFIEEGTPNFTEEGLVNFSKMRMVIFSSLYAFPYMISQQDLIVTLEFNVWDVQV